MIDTIKLVVTLPKPLRRNGINFEPSLDSVREDYHGYFRAVLNPSAAHRRNGTYRPRLTYTQRSSSMRELAIEMSLPKLLYGNNFDEVADADFNKIIDKLVLSLRSLGIWIFPHQLKAADVRKIDFCKNLIFRDYTSVSSIIKDVRSANIKKIYDIQNTNFRNGGYVYHIHTNSLDVALYDKIADLKQARVSEKRAIETGNYMQLSLLDELDKKSPISVARFEVRLNGKVKIRNELNKCSIKLEKLSFDNLFNQNVCRKVLLLHWQNIFDSIPKIPLDSDTPEKLFLEIIKDENVKPRQALSMLGYALLTKDEDQRYLRNIIDEKFGRHVWNRLKDLRAPPDKSQLKTLLAITTIIDEMKPVDIEELGLQQW
jgi:hypothetical protein